MLLLKSGYAPKPVTIRSLLCTGVASVSCCCTKIVNKWLMLCTHSVQQAWNKCLHNTHQWLCINVIIQDLSLLMVTLFFSSG